jgi:hypothetical protein
MAQEVSDKKPAEVTTESHDCLEEDIRCRAYALYEERGREDGYDINDWLRAEAELTQTAKVIAAAA